MDDGPVGVPRTASVIGLLTGKVVVVDVVVLVDLLVLVVIGGPDGFGRGAVFFVAF